MNMIRKVENRLLWKYYVQSVSQVLIIERLK
jgi:hypothetical protein